MSTCWYNHRTGGEDFVETPSDFTDYLPRIPAALLLYPMLVSRGDAPLDAYIKTMEALLLERRQWGGRHVGR